MILKNCTFFNERFEKEFGDICVENGVIESIGLFPEDGRDMHGKILLPGFVDIHVHGSAGGDAGDASREALDKMRVYLAEHGVTSFCPTLMTGPLDEMAQSAAFIAEYQHGEKAFGAKIAGIHSEGPFLSKEKCGSQNADCMVPGTCAGFDVLYNAAGGLMKLITVAPEAFDSASFIEHSTPQCTVAIGHTAASGEQCRAALTQGASHFTHLYNAMSQMTAREPGAVGTALDSKATCELICDGHHISPVVLRNTFKILGEDRAVAVSDAMRAAGLGAGEYTLGGQTVYVAENDGVARLQNKTIAASVTNLFDEFKNLLRFGIAFKAALKACTINPARAIGADGAIGSVAKGKRADFAVVNEKLELLEVYIDGILFKHSAD